jgi:hypothetical protein
MAVKSVAWKVEKMAAMMAGTLVLMLVDLKAVYLVER